MTRYLLLAAIGASAMVALGPAQSQTSALRGHNSNAPVDVAADRIEVQDRADRAIISGNVVVRQAQLTLTAARLTILYAESGGIDIKRLDATGGVNIKSPGESARGDFGIYDLERRIITLIGDVHLERGGNRVDGARLVIDLDSGRAVIDGGGPPGTTSQGGRVTGTFTVPRRGG